jgi:hypothetical protein
MTGKLVVVALGNRDSGKSSTWYGLFGRKVRTGRKKLFLTESQYVDVVLVNGSSQERKKKVEDIYLDVFLVNGSSQERKSTVEDIIGEQEPKIVLCSVQYAPDVFHSGRFVPGAKGTIQYFLQRGYAVYAHWLNPGRHDDSRPYPDNLGLVPFIRQAGGTIEQRDGKAPVTARVEEMRAFILQWASAQSLLRSVSALVSSH